MQLWTNEIGILVDESQPKGRDIVLRCNERQGTVADQTAVVLRKRDVHWKRLSEVGNGMDIVLGYPRSAYEVVLDKDRLLKSLCIRQEFDEEANVHKTYLYKFLKNEEHIARTNTLLTNLQVPASVQIQGRFVEIKHDEQVGLASGELVREASIDQLLSFLFGLVMWYWTYEYLHEGSALLHRCVVYFPLVAVGARHESVLAALVVALAAKGIFVQVDRLQAKTWYVWQMSCKDREVVRVFAKWLWSWSEQMPEDAAMYEQAYVGVSRDVFPPEFSQYSVLKKRSK